MKHTIIILEAVAAMLMLGNAAAQTQWPDKPVKIIVAYSPGGTTDFAARQLAQKLTEQTGKSFFVENKAGASGVIGTDFVAKATPDGNTLLIDDTTYAMLPHLLVKLPWDNSTALVQITSVMTAPVVAVVGINSPYKSIKDIIEGARKEPGKLTFGSAGVGSATHLAGEMFRQAGDVALTHVPYKGASEAMLGVVSGQVDVLFTGAPTAVSQVMGGKVRALLVTSTQRLPALPDIPTSAQAGIPKLLETHWFGLAAPRGTPAAVISRLQEEVRKAMESPDLQKRFVDQGGAPGGMPTAEFQRFVVEQTDTWGQVIRAARIQPE